MVDTEEGRMKNEAKNIHSVHGIRREWGRKRVCGKAGVVKIRAKNHGARQSAGNARKKDTKND